MMHYIDLERAKLLHKETIKVSGGGELGILNIQYLESVLEFIQNDDYYPNIEAKLTHLIFSVNKHHIFVDGNKRLSITLGIDILLINGYYKYIEKYISEMENISYHLAAGKISKDLLLKIVTSIINEIDYSETLKMEIYNAIM